MLTVDLGNTRLKAVRWSRTGPHLEPEVGWEGDGADLESFSRWLAGSRGLPAALASVTSPAGTDRVRSALAAAGVHLWIGPECGLENRCRPPEGVGLDRLYAAAGAAALFSRSCLVVDAGTALTVDALLVDGPVRAFLGGAIAPGPALQAAALARWTARLPAVTPEPGAQALGRCTEEAIRAGVGLGFRGAAHGLVEALVAEVGFRAPLVVLTGGARSHLLAPTPFTPRPLEEVPELVHRGLLGALLEAMERARGGG